jgi:NAD-dependent deacetylase
MSLDATVHTVRSWLRDATRIVVLTGAGISTESGLQDFRGPRGLWTRDPGAEKLSDIRYYMSDGNIRKKAWQQRLEVLARSAEPNRGHLAIVDLERRGTLHALVTQNIDGLHQKAGISPHLVIEVHGTVRTVRCMKCAWKGPMEETLARVTAGDADPPCLLCGGILKSDTISFGQPLVPTVIGRAMRAAATADLLLAVGTSLQVYPIAGAVPAAHDAGARVVILNGEPTPFDEMADAVLEGSIGEILPRLVTP